MSGQPLISYSFWPFLFLLLLFKPNKTSSFVVTSPVDNYGTTRASVIFSPAESKRVSSFAAAIDPFRAGIRPSLHPATINILTKALSADYELLQRRKKQCTPLERAQAASDLAVEALVHKRQIELERNEESFTPEEDQTIIGRAVGVVLRRNELMTLLQKKCQATSWIPRYDEWKLFGLPAHDDDPFVALQRSECLLALFLSTVEDPTLRQTGATVPDNSVVDFLDDDRRKVLLG